MILDCLLPGRPHLIRTNHPESPILDINNRIFINFVSNCFWGPPVLYFLLLFAFKLRGIERKGRQEPEGSNEKVVKGEIDPSETFPNKNDPPCQEINGATEKWV